MPNCARRRRATMNCAAPLRKAHTPKTARTSATLPVAAMARAAAATALTHAPGSADRTPGVRAAHEPRDRRAALSQPPYGRIPPAQGVLEARHPLAQGARGRPARSEVRARTRLTRRRASPNCGALVDGPGHPTDATTPVRRDAPSSIETLPPPVRLPGRQHSRRRQPPRRIARRPGTVSRPLGDEARAPEQRDRPQAVSPAL
jgi:hypothetical protein